MKRALKSLIWPRYTSSAPNLINRIGRVLHWTIVVSAFIVFGVMVEASGAPFLTTVAVFVGLLLTGRAIRYILSAE